MKKLKLKSFLSLKSPLFIFVTLLFLFSLLFIASTRIIASDPTVYVSQDGSCSGQTPCHTSIQEALDSLFAQKGTVQVTAGQYSEKLIIDSNHSGITLTGAGPDTLLTDSIILQDPSDLTIQNLKVETQAGPAIIIDGASNLKIQNSHLISQDITVQINSQQDTTLTGNTITGDLTTIENNSSNSINAQGNKWGTTNLAEIEDSIHHQSDDEGLGLVDYINPIGWDKGKLQDLAAVEFEWEDSASLDLLQFLIKTQSAPSLSPNLQISQIPAL